MSEPLDSETKEWLKQQAAEARQKRSALFAEMTAKARALQLAEAREVLASIPPLPPNQTRNFEKIFEAPPLSGEEKGEPRTIEGTVFEIYGVMTGNMSGSDDFTAFRVISEGERISSWRKGSLELTRGNFARIKYLQRGRDDDDDHIDDPVLEVWVDSGTKGWDGETCGTLRTPTTKQERGDRL
jgi:hypothetical protein